MTEAPDSMARAPLPPAEQRRVVSGLQVGIFVAAIDSTLVSVALLTIARDLGGELSYEPRPGGGSVFLLTLPLLETLP